MERIAIIGCGGAGKSSLARQLGELTGLPVVHLDREHWQPGWVEPDREEWRTRVTELAAGERWIIDGNYGGTMGIRIERADTIVFMDYSRWLCLYRAVKRAVIEKGQPRPDMAPGCEEKVDLKFYKWIWQYRATRRPGILAMLRKAESAGKRVVILRNPRAARPFLDWARAAADVSNANR